MSTSITGTSVPSTGRDPLRADRTRPVPRWWREATGAAGWLLVVAVCSVWAYGGGLREIGTLGGTLMSLGRLTGLVASALLLVQVLLMARVPVIEQAWGQDALTRAHRLVGLSSFVLMWVHVVIIWLGYAVGSELGLWGTLLDLVVDYPGMLLATAGLLALCLVVVTSLRRARSRLRYESWHLIHLYGYLGAGLALPHQLWTGQDFLASPVATALWWVAWAATAAAVIGWRVVLPVTRSLRARLRVLAVGADSPGTSTVVVGGPGAAGLRARGGQFFQWRFLDGPGWTRAHPFSLSARPDGRTFELTAVRVGDGSERLAEMRPGTHVLVEGPYGRFHDGVRTRERVLLAGGGIGMAPLRSLLEDLGEDVTDVAVIHRTSSEDGPLVDATRASAVERGARYVALVGPRVAERESWLPQEAAQLDDVEALLRLVPDVADREVFVCGAPGWMSALHRALRAAGVPTEHIHLEHFDI